MTGGFIPVALRGTNSGNKLVHISDWCAADGPLSCVICLAGHLTLVAGCCLGRYPTFCRLAGVDSTDDVTFKGKVRPIDGVDVWDLLTGANSTQPRPYTPVTEVSVVDASDSAHWWKLITLAGQSGYCEQH